MQAIDKPELAKALKKINKKFAVEFEPLECDGKSLRILNICDMQRHISQLLATGAIQQPLRDLPLWAKTWPGAMILGRFLRKFAPEGKTLLELGCGMGALSLIAANYGFSHIVATDIEPQALDFAQANVLANDLEHIIEVKRLDVTKPGLESEQKFQLIAASELLYLDELHRPLLKFLKTHLAKDGQALFCTDLARLKPRFQKLAAKDFKIQEGKIGAVSRDENGEERRIYSILILEKI